MPAVRVGVDRQDLVLPLGRQRRTERRRGRRLADTALEGDDRDPVARQHGRPDEVELLLPLGLLLLAAELEARGAARVAAGLRLLLVVAQQPVGGELHRRGVPERRTRHGPLALVVRDGRGPPGPAPRIHGPGGRLSLRQRLRLRRGLGLLVGYGGVGVGSPGLGESVAALGGVRGLRGLRCGRGWGGGRCGCLCLCLRWCRGRLRESVTALRGGGVGGGGRGPGVREGVRALGGVHVRVGGRGRGALRPGVRESVRALRGGGAGGGRRGRGLSLGREVRLCARLGEPVTALRGRGVGVGGGSRRRGVRRARGREAVTALLGRSARLGQREAALARRGRGLRRRGLGTLRQRPRGLPGLLRRRYGPLRSRCGRGGLVRGRQRRQPRLLGRGDRGARRVLGHGVLGSRVRDRGNGVGRCGRSRLRRHGVDRLGVGRCGDGLGGGGVGGLGLHRRGGHVVTRVVGVDGVGGLGGHLVGGRLGGLGRGHLRGGGRGVARLGSGGGLGLTRSRIGLRRGALGAARLRHPGFGLGRTGRVLHGIRRGLVLHGHVDRLVGSDRRGNGGGSGLRIRVHLHLRVRLRGLRLRRVRRGQPLRELPLQRARREPHRRAALDVPAPERLRLGGRVLGRRRARRRGRPVRLEAAVGGQTGHGHGRPGGRRGRRRRRVRARRRVLRVPGRMGCSRW